VQLTLIRHGETDWNSTGRIQGGVDIALNARGVAQARQLAARLAGEKFEAIYTSPQTRARTTADIIAQPLGQTPLLDERLADKRLGELEGLTIRDFQEQFPDLYRAWHDRQEPLHMPSGESHAELHARVSAFLADLRARHGESSHLAIVSHGGTLGMMLATLVALDLRRRVPFAFDNASLSRVEWRAERTLVHWLNDTCHLRNHHAENGKNP